MNRRFTTLLATVAVGVLGTASAARAQPEPWAIAVLPDTQIYSQAFPWIFQAQTSWILNALDNYNIVFVSHEGDLVHQGGLTEQWQNADAAMSILDGNLATDPDGLVPYSAAIGNHDYDVVGDRSSATNYVSYFGPSRYCGRSWYGNSSANELNHYQFFEAGGRSFLHLALEWEVEGSPFDLGTAMGWAQSILDQFPGVPTIITTHSHVQDYRPDPMDPGGRTTSPQSAGGNSGQTVFDDLVSPNPQVFMVLNGHWHRNIGSELDEGEFFIEPPATNDAGLVVYEMLADYQGYEEGASGYLRLIRFLPGGGPGDLDRIQVVTYSPILGVLDDPSSQFDFDLDFDDRFGPPRRFLIPKSATWLWHVPQSDEGTAWREPGFDDSSWDCGPAQFGYGDGDEATAIPYGADPNDKPITYYFRRRFDVEDPSILSSLELDILRDDGAVVYLNGSEVLRTNMPAPPEPIDWQERASSNVGGDQEDSFYAATLDATLLVPGSNLFAVEVHQFLPHSTDLSFDLLLTGPDVPACDDGIDNDGDGRIDFDPVTYDSPGDQTTLPAGSGDPGCRDPSWSTESPQCQDGINNDPGQDPDPGHIDYDGGHSIFGTGDPRITDPDPQCVGQPWRDKEKQSSNPCGLGAELAFLLPPLMWLCRRRTRRI